MSSRSARAVAGVPVLVVAVVALAASPAVAAAHPRPPSGKWRFDYANSGGKQARMTVSKHGHTMSGLSIVPPASCGVGTARVAVLGSFTIKSGGNGAGSDWHVGASRDVTEAVTIKQGATKSTGAELLVEFSAKTKPRVANVSLTLPSGSNCVLNFTLKAPK